MDSTDFDFSLHRIERLERKVGRLQKELRKSQDAGAVDISSARGAAPTL